jgi:diphosphomevalonate decarboxylase
MAQASAGAQKTAGDTQARAEAHPNIALVKYWGKRDLALNLPAVGSLSITLDTLWTRTRVRFDSSLTADRFLLNGCPDDRQLKRVAGCMNLLRQRAGGGAFAEIDSENNFPTGAGLASSASGFAALVVAGDAALGLKLNPAELSELARRCSGSAARSIFGGYVEWSLGSREDGTDSVARPILDAAVWALSVVVAVTATGEKSIGSTAGMRRSADTSPYYKAWVDTGEDDLVEARSAVATQDFARLAAIAEYSCLKMHALALASQPGMIYWNGATVEAMHAVRRLRAQGLAVFFTVDAGPQVKAVCLPEVADRVAAELAAVPGVLKILRCGLGGGARLIAPTETDFAAA